MDRLEIATALFLALLFGVAIGMEREVRGKAAGLRTNILICLGAAIYTVISRQMAAGSSDSVTRIAAQIVTGIGFLGAGAILRDTGGVHGLTTAATIWLVASIGMACGAGFYFLATLSTVFAMIVLIGLAKLEKPLADYIKNCMPQDNHNEQNHVGKQQSIL